MKKQFTEPGVGVPEQQSGMLTLCGIVMTLTAFLLPLKWGTLAAMTEAAGFFPEYVSDYLTITWPAHSFGIFSGIMLLIISIAVWNKTGKFNTASGIFCTLWSAGLLLAVLPGYFASGADRDFAMGELANFAGIAAWCAACQLLLHASPHWGKKMAVALLAGTLITALNGFYQYFFGFAELKAFVEQQIADGVYVPQAIRSKLTDTRISSFMASTNALAGLMLLMMPVALFYCIRWGKLFTPVNVSVPLFTAVTALIMGGTLLLCRSRSIYLILLLTGGLAVFSYAGIKLKYKIAAIIAGAVLLAGGAVFAVKYGRGLGSMAERADYLRTCAVLVMEHPVSGSGWGGFFYRHMKIKLSSTDEAARDPHNIIAAFAAQAGILSGLLALAAMIYPLAKLWKTRFSRTWESAVFWSGTMFTLHALMDCDMHIPALMAGMALLYFSALSGENGESCHSGSRKEHALLFTTVTIIAATGIWSNWTVLKGEWHLAQFTEYLSPTSAESRNRFLGMPLETFEQQAENARPSLAMIPELAGDWYLSRGNMALAQEKYEKALKLNPERPGIYRRLARLHCLRGEIAQGKAMLEEAHKRFPRNPKYSADHPENQAMLRGDFSPSEM